MFHAHTMRCAFIEQIEIIQRSEDKIVFVVFVRRKYVSRCNTQQEPQLQHLIPQNWTQVTNNQQNIQLQFTSNSQMHYLQQKQIDI